MNPDIQALVQALMQQQQMGGGAPSGQGMQVMGAPSGMGMIPPQLMSQQLMQPRPFQPGAMPQQQQQPDYY